ncbi:DUF3068 domain-containing protein [Streptomonospora salina]|uniref:DUF3068 domain-containing protein n=1 Tax=Streptomonospora salina TaxID=104205 RepID=A0A841E3K5_9ACTN|nr:DUF3068 domain-containing protein [Streptomonospora salina]MBB5997616.1 hypothetical protein [Streptomonospora salina]
MTAGSGGSDARDGRDAWDTAGPGGPVPDRPRRPGSRAVSAALARNGRLIALATAVFLITSALMLRFYVAGELEKIPARAELTMRLTDDSAAYLDTGAWDEVRGAPVERLTEISGDYAPGNSDWTAWRMSTEVSSGGTPLAYRERRVVVDRATGTAVNCCGEHVGGDREVRQAGLVLRWPAGGTWDEYPFYDADLRAAPPMVFDGGATVGGLFVRRYVQTVDTAQVPDSARPVPARELGLDRPGTVEAHRWLELERTLWVEPVTGRVVDAREVRHETLRPENGDGERLLLDADLRMAEELSDAKTGAAERRRTLLRAVRSWLPIGLGAAGGASAVWALAGAVRARRAAAQARGETQPRARS